MAYDPLTWQNEAPATSPVKFTIRDTDGNILYDNVTIDLKTSVTAGTPFNSTNMNHIEQGIFAASEEAENIQTWQLLDSILSADTAGRAKMEDGFVNLAKMAADLKFQKIYEFIGNGTSHLDWTSIPGTFKHLILIYTGLSSRVSASWDDFYLRVNGDAAANYQTTTHLTDRYINGQFNWGVTNPHAKGLHAGVLPSQNAGYLSTGSGLVLFPDYAGTTFYKSCIEMSIFFGAYNYGMMWANSYRTNAEPITHLTGYMNGGYFPRAGSVFSLYGFN